MTPTEKALKTWPPPSNPLYKAPRHPTIKLAGEIGELMDLYGKDEYKPNFDWMRCKWCKRPDYKHSDNSNTGYCFRYSENTNKYTSTVLDELGDIWYYLRILAWIYDVKLDSQSILPDNDLTYPSITSMYRHAAIILGSSDKIKVMYLNKIFKSLNQLLANLDCTLEELTELNYVKLNSNDDNHGWKNA